MADVLTQLQDQTNLLCSRLFNFLGALQRDAPPVSVKGEGVLLPNAGTIDAQAQTELMANELVESLSALGALAAALPPTDKAEAAQVAEIVELQAANAQASEELRAELAAAEGQLARLQDAFAALADLRLGAGRPAAGGGGAAGGGAAAGADGLT